MTFLEARQYLESFVNHEVHLGQKRIPFKLERVQRLLDDLGNPQNHLKIIHVAGSKGKGSICALAASILKKSGYRVGLYTSPHMNSYRERIRILDETQLSGNTQDIFPDMISKEGLCVVLEEIQPIIEKMRSKKKFGRLSFFEVYTVLALYYFCEQKVDFVVFETGLGGRLDATNAVDTLMAVIAPISLEHTNILGKTIQAIAQEKAAIIKDCKQKVVIASQEMAAKKVLKNQCLRFSIDPLWIDDYAAITTITQDIDEQVFDLTTAKEQYHQLILPFPGKHQRENAAVAVGIVECLRELGFKVPTMAIRNGLKNIFWPGRFEVVQNEPTVVIDGAHNNASMKALVDVMKETFQDRKIIVILGVSQDKDIKLICEELKKITSRIIFTKSKHPRARNLYGSVNVKEALEGAFLQCNPTDVILVTGSIFVISEVRTQLAEDLLCIN